MSWRGQPYPVAPNKRDMPFRQETCNQLHSCCAFMLCQQIERKTFCAEWPRWLDLNQPA
jgi:hypothetical protein